MRPKLHLSDEFYLQMLKTKAIKLKRIPYKSDVNADISMPSVHFYETQFGGFTEALEKAGVNADFIWELNFRKKLKDYYQVHKMLPPSPSSLNTYGRELMCFVDRIYGSWQGMLSHYQSIIPDEIKQEDEAKKSGPKFRLSEELEITTLDIPEIKPKKRAPAKKDPRQKEPKVREFVAHNPTQQQLFDELKKVREDLGYIPSLEQWYLDHGMTNIVELAKAGYGSMFRAMRYCRKFI